MADLNDIAEVVGSKPTDPFVVFMGKVDDLIRAKTAQTTGGVGLGVFDFADADWEELFCSGSGWGGSSVTDGQMIETLAQADPTFAALMEQAS